MIRSIAALHRRKTLRVAGLMSGTSADGIDAVIVDIAAGGVELVAFRTFAYSPRVRQAVLDLCDNATATVEAICHWNFALGELFADAVIRLCRLARVPLSSLHLVGSHGQTIHHLPAPRPLGRRRIRSTLQIGEPSVIAERTGVTVVADFRPRDIAAGGQGAPLVPLTDYLLFAHKRISRTVQNIGGIANVTYLPAGGGEGDTRAFDTGPGNMIIDRLAQLATGGRLAYDRDGRLAAAGQVDETMLAQLMRHAFLRRRPPKSAGREQFGRPFADAFNKRAHAAGLSPADTIATATAFTAAAIADSYRRFLGRVDEAILCGGGSRNPVLVAMLRRRLGGISVRCMDELGINADAKEAVSFAMLAARTIRGLGGNVPAVTGARRTVVLGKIVTP